MIEFYNGDIIRKSDIIQKSEIMKRSEIMKTSEIMRSIEIKRRNDKMINSEIMRKKSMMRKTEIMTSLFVCFQPVVLAGEFSNQNSTEGLFVCNPVRFGQGYTTLLLYSII